MAKMYAYVHPANPKVGDVVTVYEVEVSGDPEQLEGLSFPLPTGAIR